jgi:UDP-N-acetyl-D-mannosaminuronic acid dehydrogenase
MKHEVAVIGLGRVGLPLALCFADRGLSVIGIDNNPEQHAAIRTRTMPFEEPGMQELIERVGGDGFALSEHISDAAAAEHIVLTLGTPAVSYLEIDMRHIRTAVQSLLPVLRADHSLILRSTVAPGTTDSVAAYIDRHIDLEPGETVFVSHVPERIVEGDFLKEIDTLPCIVGGVGERSGERAGELFGAFRAPIIQTTPVQAELTKIWCNVLRYAEFSLPNALMMDCEHHGANVFEVIDLINRDYPRGGIAKPGFTAGTCLRKDFAFSEERSQSPGLMSAVSRVHESVPAFLVEGIKLRLGALHDKKVAVLGLAFKADSDDERDSLALKLVRFLERELAEVAVHDPHVRSITQPFEDAVRNADVVVVATNHSEFGRPDVLRTIADAAAPDCLIVDIWNIFGRSELFAPARETAVSEV